MASLLTPELATLARRTYRSTLKSCRVTFRDDRQALTLFHSKLREALSTPAPSVEEYKKVIEEWAGVGDFLKKNIVQGRLRDNGVYDINITPDTERGLNESIKMPTGVKKAAKPDPESVKSFPNRRRRAAEAAVAAAKAEAEKAASS